MRTMIAAVLLLGLLGSGCSYAWKSARERDMEAQLEQLKGQMTASETARRDLQAELNRLQDQRAHEIKNLTQEKTREAQDLVQAQRQLAESLKKELGDARAKLEMTERGLVLTLLDEIFFDSGKAVIKSEGVQTLAKVATVLKETVPDSPVAVEGHTDNEPIRRSGWKSNWELSSARALAVVHYFIDDQGLEPLRARAVGYGEFHPTVSNDTPQGRRQNRRVEVVILPKALQKTRAVDEQRAAVP